MWYFAGPVEEEEEEIEEEDFGFAPLVVEELYPVDKVTWVEDVTVDVCTHVEVVVGLTDEDLLQLDVVVDGPALYSGGDCCSSPYDGAFDP